MAISTSAATDIRPIVETINELTEEVRGLRADIGELNGLLGNQHSEMMSRVNEASSDITTAIAVWSP